MTIIEEPTIVSGINTDELTARLAALPANKFWLAVYPQQRELVGRVNQSGYCGGQVADLDRIAGNLEKFLGQLAENYWKMIDRLEELKAHPGRRSLSKELQAIIAGELPTIQDGFADALSAMHRQMLDAEHELGVNDHRGEFKLQNRMGLNAPGQTTGRPKRSGGRRPTAKHLADKANARKKGGKKG